MSQDLKSPVVVMAGGTGGHVFPALAVAEALRSRGEQVIWFGTRAGIEARVAVEAAFPVEWLDVQGLRGKSVMTLLLAPFRLLRASWQALQILRRHRPRAVLGMGGFVSGPGGLMAWLLHIPLFLHEQNSIVGLTNRILSRFARRSYVAFPAVAAVLPRSEYIGNPLRADFDQLEDSLSVLEMRIQQPLQLLVLGGSLGANALNHLLPQALAYVDSNLRPTVRHQCGERHHEVCEQHYRDAGVEAEVVSFIDDMYEAYSWADLVICRAGALTVAEIMAVGRAALFVPFPYAVDNHQYHNALYLQQAGAAQIMIEAEISAQSLALKLQFFQQNRDMLVNMAHAAREVYQPGAASRLADDILREVAA